MSTTTCGIHEALWLARLHRADVGALYVHVPFCAKKCAYCDFASWETRRDDPMMGEYLASLLRLVAQVSEAGLLGGCETAYVGGGTPTLMGGALCELINDMRRCAPQLTELTCEANPDSLTDELLASLPAAGCTRLSVGVQSLCDDELQELGRIHTAAQARDRVAAAVASGMRVSCDLMCATPGQTAESWKRTLEGTLELGVGHVSVYPLQIEEGTLFDRRYGDGLLPWNDPTVQAERMEQARHVLEASGYSRYEVASYAKPREECRHNASYWSAVPYLGLGTNASSMLTREGYMRLRTLAPQLPEIVADIARVRLTCTSDRFDVARARSIADLRFSLEILTHAQAAAEDLMLAARMVRGVDPGLFAHARTVLGSGVVDDTFVRCEARGLVTLVGGRWAPTAEGWLLGNELYAELWALAPGEVRQA